MNRISVSLLVAVLLLSASQLAGPQVPGDARSPTLRYVNPLSVQDSIGMGDPTVVRFKGAYYLYATGGDGNL